MTREEKIAELINIRDNFNYTLAPKEVFDDAIKALKQEPCEDAVSRQMIKEQMIKYGFHAPDMTVTEFVEDELSPVTPQPLTGHWIAKWDSDHLVVLAYECSECGMMMNVNTSQYCPNCGSKMVEPQESEEVDGSD